MTVQLDFTGEQTFRSNRGFPIVKGTLVINDADGRPTGAFEVNTGGGAESFHTTNGPLPPGRYRVSSFRERDVAGMVLNGVGFSFNLDPIGGTEVFGRDLFRIHPDGGSEQTNGCLGVREDAHKLRICRDQIRSLLENNHVEVTVNYDNVAV